MDAGSQGCSHPRLLSQATEGSTGDGAARTGTCAYIESYHLGGGGRKDELIEALHQGPNQTLTLSVKRCWSVKHLELRLEIATHCETQPKINTLKIIKGLLTTMTT